MRPKIKHFWNSMVLFFCKHRQEKQFLNPIQQIASKDFPVFQWWNALCIHNWNLIISSHYLNKRFQYVNNLGDIYIKNHLDFVIIQSAGKLWALLWETQSRTNGKKKKQNITKVLKTKRENHVFWREWVAMIHARVYG